MLNFSLSYSSIYNFLRCPFYFKMAHVLKKPKPESEIMVRGRILHEILAAYTNECYKAQVGHLDNWKEIAEPILIKACVPTDEKASILEHVHNFTSSNEIQLEGLAGVELELAFTKEFKRTAWFAPDAFFRAKIDLLYLFGTAGRVEDYKTGYSFEADENQLKEYAYLLSLVYPQIENFELVWNFTNFSHKKTLTIEKSDLKSIGEFLHGKIAKIVAEKNFKPKMGTLCATCDYWSECPAMKLRNDLIKAPSTKDEARALVEQVIAADKHSDELKTVLKGYVKDNGSVAVGDMEARFTVAESKEWDMARLFEWANQKGILLMECLNVDSRKIKKVNPPEDLYKVKPSTRFVIGKVGKE